MPGEPLSPEIPAPIVCHYRLTRDEYLDIQVYARRYRKLASSIPYVVVAFVILITALPTAIKVLAETSTEGQAGNISRAVVNVIPPFLLFGALCFLMIRTLPVRRFCSTRRLYAQPGLLDQERTITLNPDRVQCTGDDGSLIEQPLDVFSYACETPAAFVLHYRGLPNLLWLPRHGFAPEDIPRCRELLQAGVATYRIAGKQA